MKNRIAVDIWRELGFSWIRKVGYIYGDYYGMDRNKKYLAKVTAEFRPDMNNRVLELSLTGEVVYVRGKGWVEVGQIQDTIADAMKRGYFEPILPKYVVKKLLNIWDIYHLNDVKPVPEDEADRYLDCLRRYREARKLNKDRIIDYYEFMVNCYGKDFGNKWYSWKIPNPTYRWLLAKFCGFDDKEINRLTRLKQILEERTDVELNKD